MKRKTLVRLLIVLSLVLLGLLHFAYGKYIQEVTVAGSVIFEANLAEEVILREHMAVRQPDGSYALVTAAYAAQNPGDAYKEETFVKENHYTLLPGLDIPKDPHILITGKTSIPAYLFIEVKSTLDAPVTYQLDEKWVELTGAAGPDGSTVYCYEIVIDHQFTGYPIYILKENSLVTVSQYLLSRSQADGEDVLKITAKLIQRVDNATPLETYNGIN